MVKVDVTPSTPKWLLGYGARQSTGVHDRIHHRIVAMDDGTSKFILVSTDLCLFSPTVYEEAARRVRERERNRHSGDALLVVRHPYALGSGDRPARRVRGAVEGTLRASR